MELPTKKLPPKRKSPRVLCLFGPTKMGKTEMLSELNDCLIVDAEEGTAYLESMRVEANSLKDLEQVLKLLKDREERYKYIALDTIDCMVEWFEKYSLLVHNKNNPSKKADSIGSIPFGAGFHDVRVRTMSYIKRFKAFTDNLIIIGHVKKSILPNDLGEEVQTKALDLPGKLKNILMADCDAIGLVTRNSDNELIVSFKGSGETEAGSRCKHLADSVINFEWDKIYID